MDQVAFALQSNKRVVPVLHRRCDIPFRIQRLQYIDFTATYKGGFIQLLKVLNVVQPSPTTQAISQTVDRDEATRGVARIAHWVSTRRLIYFFAALLLVTVVGFTYHLYFGRIHKNVIVPANHEGWIAIGVEVRPGQSLEITASGKIVYWADKNWSAGPEGNVDDPCPHPECILKGKPAGELLGKIGEADNPFEIGVRKQLVAVAGGQLYLAVNDPQTKDNTGSFSVVVDVR